MLSEQRDVEAAAEAVGSDEMTSAARTHREKQIRPAGMSYERALEIAIAVMGQSAKSVDEFAADVLYRTPRLY